MSNFDLIVKNGQIATAADIYTADIGVKDGMITQIGTDLETGTDTGRRFGKTMVLASFCHQNSYSAY